MTCVTKRKNKTPINSKFMASMAILFIINTTNEKTRNLNNLKFLGSFKNLIILEIFRILIELNIIINFSMNYGAAPKSEILGGFKSEVQHPRFNG
jgi:hypothetical protein